MKKSLVFAISAIFVFVLGFSHAAENTEERYYIGIGASFGVFHKGLKAIWTDEDKKISNEDGKLNGKIYVSHVLKGSPADKAGLKSGDILFHIDHILAVENLEEITRHIKGGAIGETIVLKFFRANESGDLNIDWRAPLEKQVKLAKIDSVAWLPMDQVLQSYFSVGGDVQFVVEAKVSENKEAGEFTYWHRITNNGKKEIYVQWEVADKLRTGWWNRMTLIPFKPGESREFVLKSKLLPTQINRPVWGFKKGYDRADEALEKDYGFSMSGDKSKVWHKDFGIDATGFIPRKFLKELK